MKVCEQKFHYPRTVFWFISTNFSEQTVVLYWGLPALWNMTLRMKCSLFYHRTSFTLTVLVAVPCNEFHGTESLRSQHSHSSPCKYLSCMESRVHYCLSELAKWSSHTFFFFKSHLSLSSYLSPGHSISDLFRFPDEKVVKHFSHACCMPRKSNLYWFCHPPVGLSVQIMKPLNIQVWFSPASCCFLLGQNILNTLYSHTTFCY